jgi:hypothetical protein
MSNRINGPSLPQFMPVTHYAYVVSDLERAVDRWVGSVGAGPFFLLEDIQFDKLEYKSGEPAVFEHSAALGQWGSIAVELQEIKRIEPEPLRDYLVPPGGTGLVHAAFICPAGAEKEKEDLEALGYEQFLEARTGPFDFAFYEMPEESHALEVYRKNEFVDAFFPALAAAADGWDGSDPLRSGPPS